MTTEGSHEKDQQKSEFLNGGVVIRDIDSFGKEVVQEPQRLPELPWCEECWNQAADGTRDERDQLPETCDQCGSTEVFWI